jgi:protein-disulfide isomerase
MKKLLIAALFLGSGFFAQAQFSVPPNQGDRLRDASLLKPPAGAKVAIWEFDDLECPACAHGVPIVHAAAERYKIPIVHHDYPWNYHVWSFEAAVTARYLQDGGSTKLADEFRRDVFAKQTMIASREDLANFTRKWFQTHGQSLPFVMDASGNCKNEVNADHALGDRIGVRRTPCIFVVTDRSWTQILDINQLYSTIDIALTQSNVPSVGLPGKKKQRD